MGVYKTKGKPISSSNRNPNRNMNKGDYWRNSYDYRGEYFKKNPGLFGCIWFCAYCGRPLFGRKQVQVDHVVPPSKFAHKKYDRHGNLVKNTSVMAETFNNEFNLVSSCAKCNRKKSDGVGLYTARGGIAKVLQTAMFRAQDALVHTGKLGWRVSKGTARAGGKVAKKGMKTFRRRSFKGKLVILAAIAAAFAYVYVEFFS